MTSRDFCTQLVRTWIIKEKSLVYDHVYESHQHAAEYSVSCESVVDDSILEIS